MEQKTAPYKYHIDELTLKDGTTFSPGKITVFVGANNCGKTQVLKDILGYATGKRENPVLLSTLTISRPESWESFVEAYPMDIVEIQGSKQLRHTSPTMSESTVSVNRHDLDDYMRRIATQIDDRAFREATGAGMITFLNTDRRLNLTQRRSVKSIQSSGVPGVLEALYVADSTALEELKHCIKSSFNTDIYFDYTDPGTLQFRVGSDFSTVSRDSKTAYRQVSGFPILDTQGDGIRSFVGIVGALVSLKKPIVLLDEPEAFLHPPQAMQLGESIAKLAQEGQQLFISTHSADFLRGLLSTTKEATIVHITRLNNDGTKTCVLDADKMENVVNDPLLSSSRVLEGMFYKGVVATEADADATFYQRAFQKIGQADEVHFINVHNKQTLKKVISPYQQLGIRFALIADADVIRDEYEFRSLIEGIAGDMLETILKERGIVYRFFRSQSKYETLQQLYADTQKLVSIEIPNQDIGEDAIQSAVFDFRRSLNKIREDADELTQLKKNGRVSMSSNSDIQSTFDNLLMHCQQIGLFIVPVGELESWLIDYDVDRLSNKARWINLALNKLFKLTPENDKALWIFIRDLQNYLSS